MLTSLILFCDLVWRFTKEFRPNIFLPTSSTVLWSFGVCDFEYHLFACEALPGLVQKGLFLWFRAHRVWNFTKALWNICAKKFIIGHRDNVWSCTDDLEHKIITFYAIIIVNFCELLWNLSKPIPVPLLQFGQVLLPPWRFQLRDWFLLQLKNLRTLVILSRPLAGFQSVQCLKINDVTLKTCRLKARRAVQTDSKLGPSGTPTTFSMLRNIDCHVINARGASRSILKMCQESWQNAKINYWTSIQNVFLQHLITHRISLV